MGRAAKEHRSSRTDHRPEARAEGTSATAAPPQYGLRFVDQPAVGWQATLEVGAVDDPREREADALAATIMRMPAGAPPVAVTGGTGGLIQRCPGGCPPGGCGDHRKLMRSAVDAGSVDAPTRGEMARASRDGAALPPESRSFFEPRFGRALDEVRIHTGPAAAGLAERVHARAFTLGTDIYFAPGQWAPGTSQGDRLLAHELTHVAQGAGPATLRRQRAGGGDACHRYEPGERDQSYRGAGVLADDVSSHGAGYLLVADFPVGSPDLSADVGSDPDFVAWLAAVGSDPALRLELIGYSDCVGGVETNSSLRLARAASLRSALPGEVRGRVVAERAATLGTYVGPNDSREGRARNRGVLIRYQRVAEPPPPSRPEPLPEPRPPTEPQPGGEPAAGPCPRWEQFLREALHVEPSLVADITSCLCLAGGLLDLVNTSPFLLPASPVIELVDCTCNAFTLLQEIYARGADDGCFSWRNFTVSDVAALLTLTQLVAIDCLSLPVGAGLGALIGGAGGAGAGGAAGSLAGPGGTIVGGAAGGIIGGGLAAALGDIIVDVGAMALQNYLTQGTHLPINQCRACVNVGRAMGLRVDPDRCGTAPGRPR